MQETTAGPAQRGTGSVTIADIVSLAAERYGERPAARFKRDDEWRDVSYAELASTVSEIARGLVGLGLAQGDRVALLCTTRVEWTYADLAITAAGGVVVPVYPTNSADECAWVVGNSESRFVVCEDAAQVAKIEAVRGELPLLEAVVSIEPVEGALSLDELQERGRGRDAAEVAARTAAVKPADPYTIIYTSGTTGPPKGCVLTQDNYRQVTRMCEEIGVIEAGEPVYLYPAARALLRAADPAAVRGPRRAADLLERRPAADRAGPDGDQARLPALGPADLREDLHARHVQQRSREDQGRDTARPHGPPDARGRPGGARAARRRVREGRRRAVRQRPQHLRRQPQAGDLRRRADRPWRSSSSSTPAARRCSRATG